MENHDWHWARDQLLNNGIVARAEWTQNENNPAFLMRDHLNKADSMVCLRVIMCRFDHNDSWEPTRLVRTPMLVIWREDLGGGRYEWPLPHHPYVHELLHDDWFDFSEHYGELATEMGILAEVGEKKKIRE